MTSAYIHISPLLMVYIGRWRLSPQTDFSLTPCRDADCSTTWLYTLALPVAFFAAHQVLYFLLVHVACKRVIDNNPNALTVCAWASLASASHAVRAHGPFSPARAQTATWSRATARDSSSRSRLCAEARCAR